MSTWGGVTQITFSSGSWQSTYDYRLKSSLNTTNSRFFELYHVANQTHSGFSPHGIEFRNVNGTTYIYVNSDDNIYVPDYVQTSTASANHYNAIALNDVVSLIDGNNNTLAEFTVTASMLWSFGGSGGNSGQPQQPLEIPAGEFYIQNNQLVFVIQASSPSSSTDIEYKIYRGTINNMTQAFVVSNHNFGAVTTYNVGDPTNYDRWELRIDSTNPLYESEILASWPRRKRSLTFWE